MPRNVTVTFDDGSSHVYQNVPDNATPDQVSARAAQDFAGRKITSLDGGRGVGSPASPNAARVANDKISQDAQAGPSMSEELHNQVRNLVLGGVRGAGSIGATIMYPWDKGMDLIKGDRNPTLSGLVTGQQPLSRNEERRQDMDTALQGIGADPTSPAYKVGKVGVEILGTGGAGSALENGIARIPMVAKAVPNLLTAIRTGGMEAGNTSGLTNAFTRAAGGAINGGVSAGLVDPSQTETGAVVGGALPGVLKGAAVAGNALGTVTTNGAQAAGKRLMQSAIKPTIKQLQSGDADTAVDTLLQYGINPTKGGVDKLRALIDQKNQGISDAIANSNATIDKSNVLSGLSDVRSKFSNQVTPQNDLAAIQGVEDNFLAHPNYPGSTLPVQGAQDLKQGTYSVLRGKYGQLGSAETEAQKGVARGLKDQIAAAVPEVGPLNAEESKLLTTLSVTERRALMDANKNPMGLAALAHNPLGWAAFMADKSALFKSLAARIVNSTAGAPNALRALGTNQPANQLVYQTAPGLVADD